MKKKVWFGIVFLSALSLAAWSSGQESSKRRMRQKLRRLRRLKKLSHHLHRRVQVHPARRKQNLQFLKQRVPQQI